MTIVNRKSNPRQQAAGGDKIILTVGKLALVRDMGSPRLHKGEGHYDVAYWAFVEAKEAEAN